MANELGKFLKKIRVDERKLSLRQVEKRTKISNSYLSQIERGERGIPNITTLGRLANAYGISLEEITNIVGKEVKNLYIDSAVDLGKRENRLKSEANFISQEYLKLSSKNQELLKTFLQFLLKKELQEEASLNSEGRKRSK